MTHTDGEPEIMKLSIFPPGIAVIKIVKSIQSYTYTCIISSWNRWHANSHNTVNSWIWCCSKTNLGHSRTIPGLCSIQSHVHVQCNFQGQRTHFNVIFNAAVLHLPVYILQNQANWLVSADRQSYFDMHVHLHGLDKSAIVLVKEKEHANWSLQYLTSFIFP